MPESSSSPENRSPLYAKSMHSIIGGTAKKWLFTHDYHNRTNLENVEKLPTVLIETGHQRFVEALMCTDARRDMFANVIDTYLQRREYGEALRTVREYRNQNVSFDDRAFITRLFQGGAPDNVILDFCAYSVSEEEFGAVRRVIKTLWEKKNFTLASLAIQHLPARQQPLVNMWQRLIQGESITQEKMSEGIETLTKEPEEPESRSDKYERRRDDSAILSECIVALDTHNVDLSVIRFAIEEQEKLRERGYTSYSDRYEIDAKIQSALLKEKNFDEAIAFAESRKAMTYSSEEIGRAIIQHAAETKDEVLYRRGLEIMTKTHLQRIGERESYEGNETRNAWIHRISKLEEEARMHADHAICELTFGTQEKAAPHIEAMIIATEACGVPGKPECPEAHKKTLDRHRRVLKKALKGEFQTRGFLEMLPERMGWNTPVKDPAERQRNREEKMNRRQSLRYSYEDRSDSSATEVARRNASLLSSTKNLMTIMGADAAAMKLLASVTEYDTANCWERAKLLLEAKPELFTLLTSELTKNYFKKNESRYGEFDWAGLGAYYAYAESKGLLQQSDWTALWEGVQQSRMTHEGLNSIRPEFVVALVREMIKNGDPEGAWDRYEHISKMGNGMWRGVAGVTAKTHQACLAEFVRIAAHDDPLSLGIAANLQGKGEPQDTDSRSSLAYWNTEVEIQSMNGKPEEALVAEKRVIARCDSPTAVRDEARLLAMGTLRSNHQIKDSQLAMYNQDGATDNMKRRVIHTLMDHSIPGAEAMPDFKRADADPRVTSFFL